MTPVRAFARLAALAAFALAGAFAFARQGAPADPPMRAGTLSDVEGSVAYAPIGETKWQDAQRNRPVTRGDRLWTDDGARAEVHFGTSVLHMASRTFIEAVAVDSEVVQLQLNEGTVNARVRELAGGETFEIDTPQLALRAMQPGDWRVDVDPQRGFTRVAVHGGVAVAYGASGGAQQLAAGQTVAYTGRDLAQLRELPAVANDGFERWVAERNRAEDQSIAARYVPRGVVGYQELDRYGTWAQDPEYGVVWYPQVAVADWAPYRYGHWKWIAPWGWTWIDDAPWGFAPFHYGRWAMVGTRWCWVPGPLGRRPPYAPALVGFVGGDGFSLSVASGPGGAWYPLAPGEVWRPDFRASPAYVRHVNRYVVSDSRYHNTGTPRFTRRSDAITAMRIDDFHRGRAVLQRRSRVDSADIARVQPAAPSAPLRETRRAEREHDIVARAPQAPAQRQQGWQAVQGWRGQQPMQQAQQPPPRAVALPHPRPPRAQVPWRANAQAPAPAHEQASAQHHPQRDAAAGRGRPFR